MDYKELANLVGPRVGATQEWVYHVLRKGIIDGILPGGMQLKQDEISAALNVSHIPVRESLRQLEAQGLVRIQPNRGASVTQLSREMVIDMMEIRAYISANILKTAIPLMTEDDFAQVAELIDRERNERDLFVVEQINYDFHDLLLKKAGNVVADLIMEIIHANIDRYLRSSFYSSDETRQISIDEHEAILAACKARDVDTASRLLSDHILDAVKYLPSTLQ
ncbi:MAG TPA: GntR family transcriptional regulator [Eubacteriales bacterium]|nr:GntR family transcriptional regulator [Clostridia bacterium]HRV73117.1 GntR family transcriptional regulator [Eubacteriales bacterium]